MGQNTSENFQKCSKTRENLETIAKNIGEQNEKKQLFAIYVTSKTSALRATTSAAPLMSGRHPQKPSAFMRQNVKKAIETQQQVRNF